MNYMVLFTDYAIDVYVLCTDDRVQLDQYKLCSGYRAM